jgi:hypothetical protein
LTAVRKPDPAALRLVLRVVPADFRIKVHPVDFPARNILADRVPNIPPVLALPAPAPVVREVPARALVLAHVPVSADRVPAVLVLVLVDRRLQAKHLALRVLQDRRVAVDASSIPRPKKAR